MAQIIKHRRGSLESISGATKRAGELLVVTGSSGITADNSGSLLFIGIDGSTATPANKILQGSTVPNLTGGAYDTSINGIPFYDTSAQKLYILNKGGNVEVKATANTGGTGIVSGSSQVTALLPSGTVSGSSQVTDILSSLNSFSSSQETKNGFYNSFTASAESRLNQLSADSGSQASRLTALESFSSSLDSGFVTEQELSSLSGSLATKDNELFATASDHETRIDSIESSIGGASGIGLRVSSLESFTGSQETKNGFYNSFTASADSRLDQLETISASHDDRLDQLETNSGSQASQLSNLQSFTSSQQNLNATLATTGSNIFYGTQTITGSLFVTANLVVQGSSSLQNITASAVEIGTNTVILNTATPAVRFGGVSVQDSGSGQGASGSLLWDSLNNHWLYVHPSGSGEGYNSAILIAGPKNTGAIGNEATLTSGSIPVAVGEDHIDNSIITQNAGATKITIGGLLDVNGEISASSLNGIGNVATYSASVDSRLDSIESSIGGASGIGLRVSSLESFTGSQETKNSTLASYTSSVDGDLTELFATSSNHEGRIDLLESWSSSLDTNYVTETELSNLSSSLDGRIDVLESFSGSIDTTIKTKLNVEGVISGSSQVSYTGLSNIPAGIVSGSSQLDNTTINGLRVTSGELSGSFSGSFKGDGSQLTGLVTALKISGSNGSNDSVDLLTDVLTITGSGIVTAIVSDNKVTLSAVDASTSQKGVASFDADDFSVASGNVSIKDGGVKAINLNSNVAGTGISLNGVDNSIEVDYGSTSGTAVEGNTSLTVQGTTNEISVSGGSITLGAGGTVTIGLPDEVTIATASIQNNLSVGGNVSITGNLYVQGSTTTVDSTTIQLGDNVIELNGSGAANGGLLVKDPTAPNTASGSLLWDSTNDYWKGGALNSEKEFARFNSTPTSGSVQVIGANGLLVNSTITDNGVDVTITNDLTISGLTASSFVVADGSKTLTSVAAVNAGDMIQWNGSSFVASNTIDGGTF